MQSLLESFENSTTLCEWWIGCNCCEMFFRTESPLDNQNKWLNESERYIKCDLCGEVLRAKNHAEKHKI